MTDYRHVGHATARSIMVALLALGATAAPGTVAARTGTAAECAVAAAPAGAALARSSTVRPAVNGWSTHTLVNLTGDQTAGFQVTGHDRAVVVFTSAGRTWVKRTTDGGVTFGARTQLSPGSRVIGEVAVGSRGGDVDVVSVAQGPDRDLYRHSGDGGTTWDPTLSLPTLGFGQRIARGPSGLVASVALAGDLHYRVRASTNGGASFHAPVAVGRFHGCGDFAIGPAVSVTGGTIIVSFVNQDDKRVTRRSTDHGQTWSTPKVMASTAGYFVNDLATDGATVVMLYDRSAAGDLRLVARRSTDRGKTWSAEIPFGINVRGGTVERSDSRWRMVSTDGAGTWRYRVSADGHSWSSPTVMRTGGSEIARPIGVGTLGGHPVAAFLDEDIFLSRH